MRYFFLTIKKRKETILCNQVKIMTGRNQVIEEYAKKRKAFVYAWYVVHQSNGKDFALIMISRFLRM